MDGNASQPLLRIETEDSGKLHEETLLNYGPIEHIDAFGESSISSLETLDTPEEDREDVWTVTRDIEGSKGLSALRSWEGFYDRRLVEWKPVYLSEAKNQIYDAFLATQIPHTGPARTSSNPGVIIDTRTIVSSLVKLAQGRESFLYAYANEEASFKVRKNDVRMSGYSIQIFDNFTGLLIEHANRIQRLRTFIAKTTRSTQTFTAVISVASAVMPILASIESELENLQGPIQSLLQLRFLVERPRQAILCLEKIVDQMEAARSNGDVLSILFNVAHGYHEASSQLSTLSRYLLAVASRPWLESLSCYVGLSRAVFGSQGPQLFTGGSSNASSFEAVDLPSFVSTDDARTIFETGSGLQLFREYDDCHVSYKEDIYNYEHAAGLTWGFSWQDIETVSIKAKEHEAKLTNALQDFFERKDLRGQQNPYADTPTSGFQERPLATAEPGKDFADDFISIFEKPLDEVCYPTFIGPDLVSTDEIPPPNSSLFSLSFMPLISAQAQAVNDACLRLLLVQYDLRKHLTLLYRFALVTDGVYSSRLSHALFDPSLHSTGPHERHQRFGKSGIKLGYRDTWPPAGSELRLALMGILTESYFGANQPGLSVSDHDLPGGMSFAIRDMSEDEIRGCTDPNSIKALDFLKLHYQAPPPLDQVITLPALVKYDAVFKMLLRALRMQSAINELSHHCRRSGGLGRRSIFHSFCNESRHFVSTLCTYMFEGVTAYWRILDRRLRSLEQALHRTRRSEESIYQLRDFHEDLLDRLLTTLLLRPRQARLLALVEQIFGMTLKFARHIHDGWAETDGGAVTDVVKELQGQFRRQVRLFVDTCRAVSEGGGQEGGLGSASASRRDGEEHGVGQLLLRFTMNDFHAR